MAGEADPGTVSHPAPGRDAQKFAALAATVISVTRSPTVRDKRYCINSPPLSFNAGVGG